MLILVDTSVWIDHFKRTNHALVDLLAQDRVMTHPMIIGEIACGTPPNRGKLMSYFLALRQSCVVRLEEILAY